MAVLSSPHEIIKLKGCAGSALMERWRFQGLKQT